MGRTIGALLLVWIFCLSCEEERSACLEPRSVSMQVGCYTRADTGSAIADTALPNPIIAGLFADSVKGWIVGTDNLQSFPLLLSPIADSCQWIIQTDSAQVAFDTIMFYYGRRLQFLSNSCGYTYFFSLQNIRITRNSLDSVVISNPEVTSNANTEHVRLYF